MRPSAVQLGLLLLVVLALIVRLVGLDHGLPHRIEPDAEISMQVEDLRRGRSGLAREEFGSYPMLVAHLATAVFEAPPRARDVGPATQAEHRRIASKNYLDARRMVALISLLAIPGAFLLARRFVSGGWSLFAAALVAFSLLGVNFAQQGRAHAPAAALVALALAAALRLRHRGDTSSWWLAGVTSALAVACLHSGVAVLPALLAAHLLGRRGRLFDWRVLIPPLLMVAAVLLFYPALDAGGEQTLELRRQGTTLYFGAHNIELDRFNGAGFGRVLLALWWYEPGLLLLCCLGAGLWLARRGTGARLREERGGAERGDVLVLAAYLVPYLFMLGIYGETFERFVLPALAPLACLAAWCGATLVQRARVLGAIPLLALVLGVATSARLAWIRSRPDTLTQAAAWVSANAAGERVHLSPIPHVVQADSSIDLPLMRTAAAMAGPGGPRPRYYNIWSRYQRQLPEGSAPAPLFDLGWLVWSAKAAGVPAGTAPIEFLRAHPGSFFDRSGPGLFVVEDHRARPTGATDILLQDTLERLGERLARFEPDRTGFPFGYQDRREEGGAWPHVAWRCLTAGRTGPVVEVWRVAPEALQEQR